MPEPSASRVVVLDDDPTGTQSASDVEVLLRHDQGSMARALTTAPSVYVQTNSRSMTPESAVRVVERVRSAAEAAGRRLGVDVRFVLRGDSTLRGHVFAESEPLLGDDGVLLFVPAYPAAGRVTLDGVHFVREADALVPVAETEFARDPVFGFDTSNLVEFVGRRSGRSAQRADLTTVRDGGLADVLTAAVAGSVVVADVATTGDLDHIATAVQDVARTVVVRSAAPLASRLAGVTSTGWVDAASLGSRALVVCGSHTEAAGRQVASLATEVGAPTEVNSRAALASAETEARRVTEAEHATARSADVRFISTERVRLPEHGSLAHGAAIMSALTDAAGALADASDFVIVKGGITSAEVVKSSLGAVQAHVRGQIREGISVWDVVGADGRSRPCVIVPGNMGDDDCLRDLLELTLGSRGRSPAPA